MSEPAEMVERVARAIHEEFAKNKCAWVSRLEDRGLTDVTIDGVFDLKDVARAAIEAMREPTEAMAAAGQTMLDIEGDAAIIWRAMIDAALATRTQGEDG